MPTPFILIVETTLIPHYIRGNAFSYDTGQVIVSPTDNIDDLAAIFVTDFITWANDLIRFNPPPGLTPSHQYWFIRTVFGDVNYSGFHQPYSAPTPIPTSPTIVLVDISRPPYLIRGNGFLPIPGQVVVSPTDDISDPAAVTVTEFVGWNDDQVELTPPSNLDVTIYQYWFVRTVLDTANPTGFYKPYVPALPTNAPTIAFVDISTAQHVIRGNRFNVVPGQVIASPTDNMTDLAAVTITEFTGWNTEQIEFNYISTLNATLKYWFVNTILGDVNPIGFLKPYTFVMPITPASFRIAHVINVKSSYFQCHN